MGCVYIIENLENGKAYVGSTTRSGRCRWVEHKSKLRHGRHGNEHLQRAWDKYGGDAFRFTVIEGRVLLPQKLIEREQFWLDRMRAEGEIYNTGPVAINPMLGQTHTPEARRKISLANIGRTVSAAGRLAVSLAHKGKPKSAETRRRMSEGRRGMVFSDSHRQHISEARARPYPTFIHRNTGEIIPAGINLAAMCREQGLDKDCMGHVRRGERKTHRGWAIYDEPTRLAI